MNNKKLLIFVAVVILVVGTIAIILINKPKPKDEGQSTVTGVPTQTVPATGVVEGYLIFPSETIPEGMGVCAEKIDNLAMVNCTKQIRDQKYKTGVGYRMELELGNYYVYAVNDGVKAYYSEFVICGLDASCKSHTKIPVVVTAGSIQDQILPHDWYDSPATESPKVSTSPTATLTVTATVAPTATPTTKTTIIPFVTIKIPQIKLPSPTPTKIVIKIPSIKIQFP